MDTQGRTGYDYSKILNEAESKFLEIAEELKIPKKNLGYIFARNLAPASLKVDLDLSFLGYSLMFQEGVGIGVVFGTNGTKNEVLENFSEVICSKFHRPGIPLETDFFIKTGIFDVKLYYVGCSMALDSLGVVHFPEKPVCPVSEKEFCKYASEKEIHYVPLDSLRERIESFVTCGHKFLYSELEKVINSSVVFLDENQD